MGFNYGYDYPSISFSTTVEFNGVIRPTNQKLVELLVQSRFTRHESTLISNIERSQPQRYNSNFKYSKNSRIRKKKSNFKNLNFLVSKARRLKWDVATRNEFHLTVRLSVQRVDKDASKKPENKFNTGTGTSYQGRANDTHCTFHSVHLFCF